jgi:hypothetical protein
MLMNELPTAPLIRTMSAAKALGPRVYRVKANGRRRGYVAPAVSGKGWTAYTRTGEPIATRPTRDWAAQIIPAC